MLTMVENCLPSLMVTCLRRNVCSGPLGKTVFPPKVKLNLTSNSKHKPGVWACGLALPAGGHFTPAINYSPEALNFMFQPRLLLSCASIGATSPLISDTQHWSLVSVAPNSMTGRLAPSRQLIYCLCLSVDQRA